MHPLAKRAAQKYKNIPILTNLLDLKESPNRKAYFQTYYCNHNIKVNHDGRTTANYCKNRCCVICNKIRSAIRYTHYSQYFIENCQFTTLTVPNCTPDNYEQTAKRIKSVFTQIRNTLAKQGIKFQFVASLEVTINTETNTYHPHLHVVHTSVPIWTSGHAKNPYLPRNYKPEIPGQKVGNYRQGLRQNIEYQNDITRLWLKSFPEAKEYLQKVIPMGQETDRLHQVVKYSIKPFELKGKSNQETRTKYYQLYDQLYTMQKGKRNFFTNLPSPLSEKQETEQIAQTGTIQSEAQPDTYTWKSHDWINADGICLSGFIPDKNQNYVYKNTVVHNNLELPPPNRETQKEKKQSAIIQLANFNYSKNGNLEALKEQRKFTRIAKELLPGKWKPYINSDL